MATQKKVTSIDKPKRGYSRKTVTTKEKVNPVELFYKALTEFYKEDRLAPGIQTAWLPDKNCWYASIGRYPNGQHSRTILHRAYSDVCLREAVESVIEMWKNQVNPKNHYLDQFLGR